MALNQNNRTEAMRGYIGEVYVQHNLPTAGGKEAFIEYFEGMAKEYHGKRVHFKRVIAEGNCVVLDCCQKWPRDSRLVIGRALTFFD